MRTPVTYSLKDFYNSYCLKNPKAKLKSKQHKDIIETAGEVLSEVVLLDGDLKMFARLGGMHIRKVQPRGSNKAPIDFGNTKKEGTEVYHFNDHSDGYIARIIWDRKNGVLADKHMWLFKPVRAFKRKLAAKLKAGEVDYPVLTKA